MAEKETNKISGKRPPVVVVVGHVDHGKTSLLDYIRKTNIVAKEEGGITQSIGAYEIVHNNERITFIDTPGHEAFSKMRVRGAHVADIAILVVAADEGVKPQTEESIRVLEQSKTPFVVAITKVDKPNADIDRIKNDLTTHNVLLEGYGGSISFQGVSSKTGDGIKELLDLILLTAEVEDLSSSLHNSPSGVILESKIDKRKGNIVSIILKDGTLKVGDSIATTSAKGKIKVIENFLGEKVKEIIPSSPAMILGFETVPQTGEEFRGGKLSEEDLEKVQQKAGARRVAASDKKDESVIRVMLKADVAGSLEALSDLLKKIPLKENQRLEILDQSIGEISDGDVKDALATGSIILGFRVQANKTAESLARTHSVIIVTNEIIYKLVEDIERTFHEGEKKPPSGELEILAVFSAKNKIQTIGGKVITGVINNKARLEVEREGAVIGKGKILNLQARKTDVSSINTGNECGLIFESETLIQKGDKLLAR